MFERLFAVEYEIKHSPYPTTRWEGWPLSCLSSSSELPDGLRLLLDHLRVPAAVSLCRAAVSPLQTSHPHWPGQEGWDV